MKINFQDYTHQTAHTGITLLFNNSLRISERKAFRVVILGVCFVTKTYLFLIIQEKESGKTSLFRALVTGSTTPYQAEHCNSTTVSFLAQSNQFEVTFFDFDGEQDEQTSVFCLSLTFL